VITADDGHRSVYAHMLSLVHLYRIPVTLFTGFTEANFKMRRPWVSSGAPWVLQAIKDGRDPRTIVQSWQTSLAEFRPLRAKYLFYPSPQP